MWEGPQTIKEMLQRNVRDFPNRDAIASISFRTEKWVHETWKGLDRTTNHLAAGLDRIGVKKGHKIAFMQNNCVECVHTYLAVHKIGAIFIPVNTRFVAREVEQILKNSDTEHLIVAKEFIPIVEKLKDRKSGLKSITCFDKEGEIVPDWAIPFTELLGEDEPPPEVSIGADDEADLIFTSGTTGSPKGVILTQANKVANGRLSGASMDQRRWHHTHARLQTAFPFFTSAGISTTLMGWLYYGYSLILEEKFDVVKALETIEREGSTFYAAAPSMLIFILAHPRFREFDTSSIRGIVFGGSAMPEETIRRILEAWPDVKMYNFYGLTEAGPGGTCLCITGADLSKIGSVGLPWSADQEVRVVDDHGRDVKVGEVGEIIIRGPNVMKGYYKNPSATDEVLLNGWLHTGDLGCFDNDQYLYYKDRKKDMIVRGGFNIYPAEVESVMYEHPFVKQCAIVGKPHPKLGEDVLAYVILKEGKELTAEDLIIFCSERLADFKCPRDIRFVESLPVNPTGKVDKKKLRVGSQ
jgi:acyl-CoA synthetase (AMP-forming)/AMP-acid ligase II